MAYYVPQTGESLAQISGVGAVKLEQLGKEFFAEVGISAREHGVDERLGSIAARSAVKFRQDTSAISKSL